MRTALIKLGTLTLLYAGVGCAQAPQKILVKAGQTVDLWYGVNVTGKVNLAIRSRDGTNKIKLWWITWGIGSTQELGDQHSDGALPIPISWWRGVVSAKLRGQAYSDSTVYVSDRVSVDKTLTFDWNPN